MATVTSGSSGTQLSGLASGLDWTSIVNSLVTIEQAPETLWNQQITQYTSQQNDWNQISTDLTNVTNDLANLKDPNFYTNRTATPSDSAVATAQANAGTPTGTFNFKITQLATAAVQNGTPSAGAPLSSTGDVSGVVLSGAGFATPVTAGTFTVNGNAVTVATTDTLQSVFDKISAATGGAVTASYNPSTDEISLAGTGEIILGSSNDTSNFLSVADLYSNGTGAVTSASALGSVNQNASLADSNLSTAVTDGGSGAGVFSINGVSIDYNASKDSINDVLQRINESSAGVSATYNSLSDTFQLTNTTQGNIGITLKDVTGNFLAATGLSGGTLQRGTNLQYSINGGATQTSQTNQITSTTSGITGLTVNVQQTGSVSVTVAADTSKISSAISSFVSDYNTLQTYISSKTATSTDSSGNVTAGDLTGDLNAEGLASSLRTFIDASPLSGTVSSLASLGIEGNGNNNTLAINDTTALSNALANNLSQVKTLFSDSTSGIATQLGNFITNFNGPTGTLKTITTNLGGEITTNNTDITNLEAKIAVDKANITQEFVNYENVASSTNSQKTYLNSFFNPSSTAG